MPIYEYWCLDCQRKITLYLREFGQNPPPCPDCGNNHLNRLFSSFSVHKTDKSIYEDILNDFQLTNAMLRNEPKALAEWNRRLSRGEKPAPEYEEMVEKLERGEMPTGLSLNAEKKAT